MKFQSIKFFLNGYSIGFLSRLSIFKILNIKEKVITKLKKPGIIELNFFDKILGY